MRKMAFVLRSDEKSTRPAKWITLTGEGTLTADGENSTDGSTQTFNLDYDKKSDAYAFYCIHSKKYLGILTVEKGNKLGLAPGSYIAPTTAPNDPLNSPQHFQLSGTGNAFTITSTGAAGGAWAIDGSGNIAASTKNSDLFSFFPFFDY
jgi:hypothetical protein